MNAVALMHTCLHIFNSWYAMKNSQQNDKCRNEILSKTVINQ